MPSGDSELNNIIKELSIEYKSPLFPAHLTLLGDLIGDKQEIEKDALHLAQQIRPFSIRLAGLDIQENYFRCLYIKAEENKLLSRANEFARKIFHREKDPKFMPHISLMYGKISGKEAIIKRLGISAEFEVRSIHLYSCDGEPKDWYPIREFTFRTATFKRNPLF